MAQVPPAPTARQTPLTCNGHTRPVVDLHFNPDTTEGSFLLSAAKGTATTGGEHAPLMPGAL